MIGFKRFQICQMGIAALLFAANASADNNKENEFKASLAGGQETPAISTTGSGQFTATLNDAEDELSFELTYTGLEGGSVLFSHVHLGQTGVAGGVMFFLCGGGSKPACPAQPATITGTVHASDVVTITAQGIAAGEFAEAIRAMRQGIAYANVHTSTYPSGEIRGQVNDLQKGKAKGQGNGKGKGKGNE